MLECFLSGFCPSSREGLEGTQENLNALLKYALSGLRAVNRLTTVRGVDTNRNSLWASVCEILPTIPPKFYCRAHGQDIRFQANYTSWKSVFNDVYINTIPQPRVSITKIGKSQDHL